MNISTNRFFKSLDIGRYYKMNDDELESEATKYHIGGYFDGRIIRREIIIEQLIAKDNARMFRFTLIASISTLFVAIISFILSLISLFLN